MDKKAALEILNLDEAATLTEAKRAYRNLAKRYHPDVMEKKPHAKKDTEARMKDINLAFRYLAPLLKLNAPVKKSSKPTPDDEFPEMQPPKIKKPGWDVFFTKCEEFLNRLFFQKEKPVVSKNQKQKRYPEQKSKKGKDPFRDVLKKAHERPVNCESKKTETPKKRNPTKTDSFSDYQRYMGLKQKIKSGHSRKNSSMSIGRVTKIDPVNRIDAINKD